MKFLKLTLVNTRLVSLRKSLIITAAVLGGAALMTRGQYQKLPDLSRVFDFPDAPVQQGGVAASINSVVKAVKAAIAPPPQNGPSIDDRLAIAQARLSVPIVVTSGLRTVAENLAVGGRPASLHLTNRARDISLTGHNLPALYSALQAAGFTGFGFYERHIHADLGGARRWYGSGAARALWANNSQLVA